MTVTERAWSGRLAFGPWWLLYSGPIGPTDPHAHHAYQIVVNRGRIAVQLSGGGPAVGPIVVIDPDVTHEITGRRPHALVVYIDPDTDAGRRLSARRARAADVLDGVSNVVSAMHPDDWYQAEQIVGRVLGTILPGPGRDAPVQHAAVRETLRALPDLVVDGVTVRSMAERTGLSTSRLTHLFSREVGLPFRSYTKWLRLVGAAEHLSNGASITEAAHRAGFADGPHFTRTFRAMFGLTPTDAIGHGTWLTP